MPAEYKNNMGSGDLGFTELFGGRRVPKTHRRIKLNALLDDLNCLLGLLKTGLRAPAAKKEITAAQNALIKASAAIAGLKTGLKPETEVLETLILSKAKKLKPAKKFVLPGSNETEALAHLARAKSRVCEILAWEISARGPAVYLNRLSDYLFLLALSRATAAKK